MGVPDALRAICTAFHPPVGYVPEEEEHPLLTTGSAAVSPLVWHHVIWINPLKSLPSGCHYSHYSHYSSLSPVVGTGPRPPQHYYDDPALLGSDVEQ